jgi:hypothetical protein
MTSSQQSVTGVACLAGLRKAALIETASYMLTWHSYQQYTSYKTFNGSVCAYTEKLKRNKYKNEDDVHLLRARDNEGGPGHEGVQVRRVLVRQGRRQGEA